MGVNIFIHDWSIDLSVLSLAETEKVQSHL